jgi:hypothetical protein
MAVRSQFNNRLAPLGALAAFTGQPEETKLGNAISVAIYVSHLSTLDIQQAPNKSNFYLFHHYTIQPNQQYIIQVPCALEYFRINIHNEAVTSQAYCYMVTSLVQELTQDPSGGIVSVSNFPAVQDISGSVSIDNFPAQQLVAGENSNYVFYPTAANNIPAIYADGVKGTDVAGGWQYANGITNKINWYCYGSLTPETDYKVSQLSSMYAVVNNLSTLGLNTAQNPWIMIYTRMDSGTNSGAFFKSKLFFGSNAHTDINGVKLLYTGEDPVDIHPEITGINRIQLQFISALSDNKQLADVQNESILAGSLQTTNNTTPVNSFFFTMTEFGVDWVKSPAVLPIEFGKVQIGGVVNLTPVANTVTITQAVSGVNFTSTAFDMGENSLLDVLMLTTTTGSFAAGNVRLDYSPDGVNWTPNNTTTYAFTAGDPHAVVLGVKTGSRYVRVSTGGASAFRSDSFRITFSSKRD